MRDGLMRFPKEGSPVSQQCGQYKLIKRFIECPFLPGSAGRVAAPAGNAARLPVATPSAASSDSRRRGNGSGTACICNRIRVRCSQFCPEVLNQHVKIALCQDYINICTDFSFFSGYVLI